MIITLLHPSRSRAKKARATHDLWMSRISKKHEIEYILSLDSLDPKLMNYHTEFNGRVNLTINNNDCVVKATNEAASISQGELLVYLSDDFDCPDNWDEQLVSVVPPNACEYLIKVDDRLQPFQAKVLTIPIMSRGLYQRLGYFWHPGYRSMFVDEDLYHVCEKLNCLVKAPQLQFPHLHYSVGKARHDDTYRQSEANWNQGKAFFQQRKRQNFGIHA